MANFLIYPFKTMRITQNYNGLTSHKPHTTGNPKDYPIDEGDKDTGRSPMYCPCDEMKIVRIVGVGNGYTNGIWLTSTKKVIFPDLTTDYATLLAYHPNDDDLKKLKVGQKFKRFEYMFREGNDGATGYHIHFSVGKGKIKGNGCIKNSNGKYVLTTTDGAIKPENAMAIDESFTKVVNRAGLDFKTLKSVEAEYERKKSKKAKYTVGEYKVTADVLLVRRGPGVNFDAKTFQQLTLNAQRAIKEKMGRAVNGYVKGMECTVSEVNANWGKTPSGWICLDYCKKIKK